MFPCVSGIIPGHRFEKIGERAAGERFLERRLYGGEDPAEHHLDLPSHWALLIRLVGVWREGTTLLDCAVDRLEGDLFRRLREPGAAARATMCEHEARRAE